MATGNVRERLTKNGIVYQITIDRGVNQFSGKRERQYITFKGTRRKAEAEMNRLVAEANGGNYVLNTSSTLLSAWMYQWLALYCTNLSVTSISGYEGQIKRYLDPYIGKIPLKALQNSHIQGWINALKAKGLAPKTIRNVYLNLQSAMKKAKHLKMINENPCEGTEMPKREKPKYNIYTTEEINDMLEKAKGTSMYFPLLIESMSGLRRGELLALRWGDIDLEKKVMHIHRNRVYAGGKVYEKSPKTETSIRDITFGDRMKEAFIEEYQRYLDDKEEYGVLFKDDGYVIRQWNGEPYHPQSWKCKWQRFTDAAGIPHIRFHDLRHSHCTALIESGVPIKTVQYRMGHASIQTTMDIYAHCTAKMQHDAADRMDEILFGA